MREMNFFFRLGRGIVGIFVGCLIIMFCLRTCESLYEKESLGGAIGRSVKDFKTECDKLDEEKIGKEEI